MHKNLKNISISMIVLCVASCMYAEAGAGTPSTAENPNGRSWVEYIRQKTAANLAVGANARAIANERLQKGNAAVAAANQKKAEAAAAAASEAASKANQVEELKAAHARELAELTAKHKAALDALGASADQATPAASTVSGSSTTGATAKAPVPVAGYDMLVRDSNGMVKIPIDKITYYLGAPVNKYLKNSDGDKGTELKNMAMADINKRSKIAPDQKAVAAMKVFYKKAVEGKQKNFTVNAAFLAPNLLKKA